AGKRNKGKKEIAVNRSLELKNAIADYREALKTIPSGFERWPQIQENQKRIKAYFKASDEDWQSWRWHIENRITKTIVLKNLLPLGKSEIEEIDKTGSLYRWAVSPYYLSLIDPSNPEDPVRRQCIPTLQEYEDMRGRADPMGEEECSPTDAITRRYADRLIIKVTNQCAMYCRHCQRRRSIGEIDRAATRHQLEEALEYVRQNDEIRDVLLTGGDSLMLDNRTIAWLLEELDRIPHVEIKRLGSRTLVTLPQRIDDELCHILSQHLPLYINTHFNHPLEVTPAAQEACFKLSRTGVSIGNQSVLLKGVNNDPFIFRKLNQDLLKIMVRPYYIFHAKAVRGTTHFRTKVEEGIEIMEKLRGYTSGLAVPTFVVNAPRGLGKTPMLPEYLISMGKGYITIRTWENRVIRYDN
ncbi:MAG TPA: glutamate 2,3-aminomutase, partial [Candidatus Limnocylindrales bacterium]|nr:glutamate 2,3-aminomutase [Candidatus Limnocylindrales bacterium]